MESRPNQLANDRILVRKVLAGDQRAFSQIIKATEALVAQIIFKMIANPDDRKDMAQDVYLKVYQQLGRFRFQAKLSTWIGQITYHTCLHHLERKKIALVPIGDSDLEPSPGFSTPFENEIESQLIREELSQLVADAMDQLNPIYRTLITLYHQEELSYSEIGQIVQLPEGTVKSYLFRARKVLKEHVLWIYNTKIG